MKDRLALDQAMPLKKIHSMPLAEIQTVRETGNLDAAPVNITAPMPADGLVAAGDAGETLGPVGMPLPLPLIDDATRGLALTLARPGVMTFGFEATVAFVTVLVDDGLTEGDETLLAVPGVPTRLVGDRVPADWKPVGAADEATDELAVLVTLDARTSDGGLVDGVKDEEAADVDPDDPVGNDPTGEIGIVVDAGDVDVDVDDVDDVDADVVEFVEEEVDEVDVDEVDMGGEDVVDDDAGDNVGDDIGDDDDGAADVLAEVVEDAATGPGLICPPSATIDPAVPDRSP